MSWPKPPEYYDLPEGSPKVVLQTAQWPVIYPAPTIGQAVTNFRTEDWTTVAGMTLAGAVLGYWAGSMNHFQRPAMYFGSFLLGKSGMFMGLQQSSLRLAGFKENDTEVQANMPGLLKPEAY